MWVSITQTSSKSFIIGPLAAYQETGWLKANNIDDASKFSYEVAKVYAFFL